MCILQGSWAVLEEQVTRVGVDFFLDLINNHEEIRLGPELFNTFINHYYDQTEMFCQFQI